MATVPKNREELNAFITNTVAVLNALANLTPEQAKDLFEIKVKDEKGNARAKKYYEAHKEEIAKRRKEKRAKSGDEGSEASTSAEPKK